MGAFIIMGILIAIAVIFPPLALIIVPFILISILVGFGMRTLSNAFSEPTRREIAQGSERIVEAIDRLNKERWAAQFDDVEVNEDGNLRMIEEEVVAPAPKETPKSPTKKKSKPRAKKKKDELPNAKDLIKDIEKELFGKDK